MKKIHLGLAAAAGLMLSTSVMADGFEFDQSNMYFGGGVSNNSVSGFDSAFGFQVFGGYNFGEIFGVDQLDFIVEAGFMNTDDFEANTFFGTVTTSHSGLWTTGGVAYRFNPDWSFFGRAGLDFGDDDGFMIGGGAAYHLNENLELRGELVERDNITSVQFNVAYHF
ncbi:outer membrane beta-barrel protein [Natronospira bacteriovora]|uniref:Outer membrane beta-barrel protein n=1 Tax=Natronospira bacteriovora TaxID=3069753 RepID=A0ABU0W8D3_9GAMM|nr:outer membrane beta-barrel protein [Natronospira sp. AB-CW4]MDQ2070299.1 outer membrane beta-barrel protein [Natronospira sp. AB-CW4]